ncbi:MAG: nucleic acid/nucleotide deaminase domain-containing protein [Gammaproteobacteria bacterium]|nr:nucleic acid/nucleotide deaminase domain-containing protein [Gammaproteobacteria bacterium]MCD8542946.1 nucleic acid/nucleotide deaminase domain-containing protein [Gammaproteobacteria bacterium]
MRLTSHIRKKKYTSASFGISKLCCACCNLSLCAVTAENIHQITTRGQHGQYYGWVMPDFVRNNPALLAKFLGKEAYRIYESLSKQDQEKFLLAIEEARIPIKQSKQGKCMIADSSESDVYFGLSCESDGELEAVAHDQTLQEIPHLRELKRSYSEEYNNLVRVGVTPEKIYALYKESPDKLEALGDKRSVSIIEDYGSENEVIEDLSKLFDKNEDVFWDFIDDDENAIHHHGFNTTLNAVLQEIPSSSDSDEEASVYSFKRPYRCAAANLLEDNGWEYEQDSEGNWGYPEDRSENSNVEENFTVTSTDEDCSEESDYSSGCSCR